VENAQVGSDELEMTMRLFSRRMLVIKTLRGLLATQMWGTSEGTKLTMSPEQRRP
jgi:hypothetical protein